MHAVVERRRTSRAVRALIGSCSALAFVAGVALAHSPKVDKDPPSDAGRAAVQQAQNLTLALLDAAQHVASSAPGNRGRAIADLVAVAKGRHDALLALLAADPEAAYDAALPASLRARFPAEAGPFVEQEATEEGDLEVAHVDYEDPSLDHYEYALNTPHGRLSLHFAHKAPDVATGAHVRVTGLRIDGALLAESGDSVAFTTKAAALANTLGAQKTLTILVNYTTNPVQPFTVASAQSMMFGTVSNYWYENSYQQTTLTGDVAGWFTIVPSATTCDYTYVESQAKSAAQKAGYNLGNYTRLLYVMPASGCGWAGLSYIGGTPSRSWVISNYFRLSTIAHELGHALGLYHSHSLDCGTASIAATGCAKSEYGDVFDVMGTAATHYNAFQKERLGWLNAGVSPPIITLAGSGSASYTIAPLERTRDTSPRALKISRAAACGSASDYLYVESRQAIGFDAGLASNASMMSGVLMHDAAPSSGDSSYLLDMTPATAAWADAALGAGASFTDPGSGVVITPASVGSGGSTVNVAYPPAACTHAAPTVTLTPSGTQYTSAGATTTFTATVKNNDGCGCPSAPFNVSATVPAGWGASNPQTASIAPGTTGAAVLSVTAAGSAAAAYYTVTTTASNASASSYAGSATATVAVMAALSVGASSDKTAYTRPGRPNQTTYATITTTVASGSTVVAGAAVSVKVTDPKGNVTTLSSTTGSNGAAKVSYGIKGKSASLGTYAFTATATMGSMTRSASGTFVVQ
jgi:hypothetical protein